MNTQATALPEGAFSLEDLMMLSPAERASVESDMKEEGFAIPGEAPAAEAQPAADPTPSPAPAAPDAAPTEPVVAPHDRLADVRAAADAAKKAIKDVKVLYNEGQITDDQFDEMIDVAADQLAVAKAELPTVQKQVQNSDDAWFGMVGQAISTLGLQPNTAEIAIYDRVLREVETNYASLPDPEKVRLAEIEFRRMFPATPASAQRANPAPTRQQREPDDDDTYEIEPEDRNAFGSVVPALRRVPAESYNPDQSQFADIVALQNAGQVHKVEERLSKLTPEQLKQFQRYG